MMDAQYISDWDHKSIELPHDKVEQTSITVHQFTFDLQNYRCLFTLLFMFVNYESLWDESYFQID